MATAPAGLKPLRKVIVFAAWALAVVPAQSASFEKDVSPLLCKYCYTCHGNGAKSGGVALDSSEAIAWDTVLSRVRAHEMPPLTVKLQPSDAEREAIGNWIETERGRHAAARPALIRRLNRAEYNNTIRDLVGVDFHPADDFPADNSGYGFDNIGEVLALPPVLMEKYLAAANTILDKAIATEPIPSRVRRLKANLMEMGFNADGDRGDGWMPLTALEEDCLAVSMPVAGGDYIIRVQAFGKVRGTSTDPIILTGTLDNAVTNEWTITATEQAPGIYEARIGVPEGKHRFVVLNHRIRGGKNELQMRNGRIGAQQTGAIWVKWVEIEGPVAGGDDALSGIEPGGHARGQETARDWRQLQGAERGRIRFAGGGVCAAGGNRRRAHGVPRGWKARKDVRCAGAGRHDADRGTTGFFNGIIEGAAARL